MHEYKVVQVDGDCTELNQAAADGFLFCEWLPGPQGTWPKALIVRSEGALTRFEEFAGHFFTPENAQRLASFAEHVRAITEPAPPFPEQQAQPVDAPPPAPSPPADAPEAPPDAVAPADAAGAP